MLRVLAMLFLGTALLWGSAVAAAQSSESAYDTSKITTLEGTVSDFQFIQPHPLIFLDVKDDKGNVEKWFVEMPAPSRLRQYGWTSKKLHQGQRIRVMGHAAKDGKKSLSISKIYDESGKEIPLGPSAAEKKRS
jgi:hypothetical protein